ncbi:MAG: glycosyltransferase [Gemmatimonas sp.]|nr:glycosyltransferase [Gemmatimonas sp.]
MAPSYRGQHQQVSSGVRVHRFRYAPAGLETLTHDQTVPDRLRDHPLYAALLPGYVVAGSIAAARLARSGGFDVIHAFWPLPHGIFGLAARGVARVPLVSTFFGAELRWVTRQLPYLTPLLKAIIRRSDAVTAISNHTAGEVRSLVPAANVVRIPFGAAIEAPETATNGGAHASASEEYRLLFVGRLVERKGMELLLRAIAHLRRECPVSLTVVGDGPLRPQLERLASGMRIEESVRFTGYVSVEELGRLYSMADAFVLPAVQDSKGDVEGLGVVLIEALTHGIPVIASRSGGIPDIVRDEETGLLVDPGDVESLSAAIRRLRADPDLARRLVDSGRQHVAKTFSWDVIVNDLQALYEQLALQPGTVSSRHGA